MFINDDVILASLLTDAALTYINNKHATKNMTLVDASNNPEKLRYSFNFMNIKPKLKVGVFVRIVDKRNIFYKGYTSNWNKELFKNNQVLKTQPPIHRIEDIDGEKNKGYYEQELLKSDFDFESKNEVLESLELIFTVSKYKDDKK